MSSDWKTFQASQVCGKHKSAMSTGPFGSAISSRFFVDSGIPVIRGGNLSQDVGTRLNHEDLVFITEDKAREFERSTVNRGDLIFTCWGTIDQVGLIDERSHYEEYIISNKQMKMTPDPSIADSRFLYYQFSSPKIRSWIIDNGIGSSVPGFNLGILKSIELNIPPLSEQKAIAHILGTLDDRIELNRKTNETLEAMARALFKSWFVDFDPVRAKAEGRPTGLPDEISDLFPDSFEESELGEIPSGWEASAIYDLAHYINGASHSSMHLNDESRGLPVIKINELKNGITTQTRYWDADYKEKHLVGAGDILFSWSGNPDTSIGTFVWAGPRGLLNQHIFNVVPKKAALRSFLLILLREKQPLFAEIARDKQTTGLGHVTIKDLKENYATLPHGSVLEAFAGIVNPLLRKCENQSLQISALVNMRDTLLPKLISGELRIPEAERLLEEAGV